MRNLDHGRGRRLVARALELAAPHVAEAAADRLGRVEVDDQQSLLEPRRPGDHLALVVEHDRVAVEDQLVLAADEVAEGEIRRVVPRPRDEHLLAVLGLADVEGRGREVDDQLRARQREIGGGRPRLPDVLTDRRADEHVAAAEQEQVAAGGEVAVLVEDAVVRQVVLAVHPLQLSVREHGARVREVALEDRAADEGGDPLRRERDLVERGPGRLEEARPQEQVLGRIPGDGELGEDDEVGAGRAGLPDRVDDERPVPGEIADDGIELGEREPHATPTMFLTARHKLHSTVMLAPLTIARRFRGPRTSANGGYAVGLLAQAARELGLDDGRASR